MKSLQKSTFVWLPSFLSLKKTNTKPFQGAKSLEKCCCLIAIIETNKHMFQVYSTPPRQCSSVITVTETRHSRGVYATRKVHLFTSYNQKKINTAKVGRDASRAAWKAALARTRPVCTCKHVSCLTIQKQIKSKCLQCHQKINFFSQCHCGTNRHKDIKVTRKENLISFNHWSK